MARTYPHYTVVADSNTGEWLGEPKHVGEVIAAEWDAKFDTDQEHFDTYEAPIYDETGAATLDTETRAITVTWTDDDLTVDDLLMYMLGLTSDELVQARVMAATNRVLEQQRQEFVGPLPPVGFPGSWV